MSEYDIALFDDSDEEALSIIGPGIHAYNVAHAGESGRQPLCVVLRDDDGQILGGLTGSTGWGWMHVDLLWLPESVREQGLGRRILAMAEEEARNRGATQVYLDTFSFQAPEFYAKLGYSVFGELPDYPQGHSRYYMVKAL